VPVPALPRGLGGGTVRGRRRAAQPNGSSPKVEPSAATDDRTDDAPTVVHRGPPGADLHPGGRRRLRGRYEILEVCGSGGEGHVLRALDHLHSRQVAIKVRDLDPHDLPRRREILNEASVLLRMTPHPHASVVREDFIVGDRYYLVMDWIDGTPSNRLLAEAGASGLPAPTVLRWMDQVAEVLDHLHTLVPPIVHGDVKPGNVIVTAGPDGQAILVDFGISQRHEGSEDGGTDPVAAREAVGSPGFMAPEIVGGEPPTSATDIFGLAATTFTLLLGEPPRVGQPPDWQRIASGAEARLLAATFKGGLALDPARRPTSARAFITAVRSASGATRPAAPNPATVTTP